MKYFLTLLWIFSSFANAAEVNSAVFNSATQSLTVEMSYYGSCEIHNFTLDLDSECDQDAAIAGRISDSGWEDTCIDQEQSTVLEFPLNLDKIQCRPRFLYLYTDRGVTEDPIPLKIKIKR